MTISALEYEEFILSLNEFPLEINYEDVATTCRNTLSILKSGDAREVLRLEIVTTDFLATLISKNLLKHSRAFTFVVRNIHLLGLERRIKLMNNFYFFVKEVQIAYNEFQLRQETLILNYALSRYPYFKFILFDALCKVNYKNVEEFQCFVEKLFKNFHLSKTEKLIPTRNLTEKEIYISKLFSKNKPK